MLELNVIREKLPKKQARNRIFFISGVLLAAFLGWVVWDVNRATPQSIFWDMIRSSLVTKSVTKDLKAKNGTSNVLNEHIQLQLGGTKLAHATITLTTKNSKVTTEEITTPKTDYVQYVSIMTSVKDANNKALDFSSILRQWAKTDIPNQPTATTFLNRAVLGVVFIAALSPQQQQQLWELIQQNNVYVVDFANAMHRVSNGQNTYSYNVKLSPSGYLISLQTFAKDVGMQPQSMINFPNKQPIDFTFTVDASTHQLVSINFRSVNETEIYSSYNTTPSVQLPKALLTTTQLHQRLQAIVPSSTQ